MHVAVPPAPGQTGWVSSVHKNTAQVVVKESLGTIDKCYMLLHDECRSAHRKFTPLRLAMNQIYFN